MKNTARICDRIGSSFPSNPMTITHLTNGGIILHWGGHWPKRMIVLLHPDVPWHWHIHCLFPLHLSHERITNTGCANRLRQLCAVRGIRSKGEEDNSWLYQAETCKLTAFSVIPQKSMDAALARLVIIWGQMPVPSKFYTIHPPFGTCNECRGDNRT